jgi:hypothetical protein
VVTTAHTGTVTEVATREVHREEVAAAIVATDDGVHHPEETSAAGDHRSTRALRWAAIEVVHLQ